MPIDITTEQTLYEGIGLRVEEFLLRLNEELSKRGYVMSQANEGFSFSDFFNKVHVYAYGEGENLRYTFRISMTTICAITLIVGVLFAFVVGIIGFFIWYLKYSNARKAFMASGEAAASLVKA
jgi:Flp pilus assembly protein TadB